MWGWNKKTISKKHLDVHSCFYTEIIKYSAPPHTSSDRPFLHSVIQNLPVAKGYLTVRCSDHDGCIQSSVSGTVVSAVEVPSSII